MNSSLVILKALDAHLNAEVELTLYGRAALQLGFPNPREDFAMTRDVDAVLWLDQAKQLLARTNFWDAVEATDSSLREQELFISHFFTEDQVGLRPEWKQHRVPIAGTWQRLRLLRLGDLDLLLSKLMRDDPIDQSDALFIVQAGSLTVTTIRHAIASARVPNSPEIQDQFRSASQRLLAALERR